MRVVIGAAHTEQGARLPVCRVQEDRRRLAGGGVGPAEVGPSAREDARVGTAERLDRHVRVADEDEVRTGRGEDAQQPGSGEGQLLGVVDDDEPHVGAYPRERLRVVLEQVGRGGEDPGRVVGAGPGEGRDLVVLAQHLRRGDPLGAAVLGSEGGQLVGLDAVLDRPHEQVAQLGAEPPLVQGDPHVLGPRRRGGVARGVAGEQLTEDDVLLGTADQPGRRRRRGGPPRGAGCRTRRPGACGPGARSRCGPAARSPAPAAARPPRGST